MCRADRDGFYRLPAETPISTADDLKTRFPILTFGDFLYFVGFQVEYTAVRLARRVWAAAQWAAWAALTLLAVLLLCRCTCARGRTPRWCWPLVSLAVLVRCMCGFEFITTFLILCEIPLCYAAAKAYCVEKAQIGRAHV